MKPASYQTLALQLSRIQTFLPSLSRLVPDPTLHQLQRRQGSTAANPLKASRDPNVRRSSSAVLLEMDDDEDAYDYPDYSNVHIPTSSSSASAAATATATVSSNANRNVISRHHIISPRTAAIDSAQAYRKLNYTKRKNPIFTGRSSHRMTQSPRITVVTNYAPEAHSQPEPLITECTCGFQKQQDVLRDSHEPLPPPLPEPIYSVHKRVLPSILTALSSPQGRQHLQESLMAETAESYWALTEQFVNQSDPAYCGVTTLLMILNAMNIDPNVRWKGGWRFFGNEDVLLHGCCLNAERIRRVGITMEQFTVLGTCHGLNITMKRPATDAGSSSSSSASSQPRYTIQDFRNDIRNTLDSRFNHDNSMLVTSFSRAALQQTGDGHYSPIAAYHEASDSVLILDVARFKYAPYWTTVEDLYQAMEPLDTATQLPRGWYVMKPPLAVSHQHEMTSEDRRPAHLVPTIKDTGSCPVGKIKVEFCKAKDLSH